jgi:hypothetical protein
MITQKDIDYLRWIAQRLVNRYGEDPKISLVVDEILVKIISDISTYKSYSGSVSESAQSCVKNLQEVIAYTNRLSTISIDTSKQIIIDKNTHTFENIDISEIFK